MISGGGGQRINIWPYVGRAERGENLGPVNGLIVAPKQKKDIKNIVILFPKGRGRELGRVLRTLAAFMREDLAVRKEV